MQEFFVGTNFEKMAREYNAKYQKGVGVLEQNFDRDLAIYGKNLLYRIFSLIYLMQKDCGKNPKFLPVLSRLNGIKTELKFDCERLFFCDFNWSENDEKSLLKSLLNHKIFVENSLKIASDAAGFFRAIFAKNGQKNADFCKKNDDFNKNRAKTRNEADENFDENLSKIEDKIKEKFDEKIDKNFEKNTQKNLPRNFEFYFDNFCDNLGDFFLQLSVFYGVISKENLG